MILYGSKIWAVTDKMMTVLEGFNQGIARRIAEMTARKGYIGEWEWALVYAKLDTTGILPIREYVRK